MTESLTMEMFIEYSGPISFDIKKELVSQLRTNLLPHSLNSTAVKRSMYVLEELLGNVHEYYKANQLLTETIVVQVLPQAQNALCFSVSSLVTNSHTSDLINRIDRVNALSEGELRMLFQSTLSPTQGVMEQSGLGLLTIRLKTGQPIIALLESTKEDLQLIHITTTLNIL